MNWVIHKTTQILIESKELLLSLLTTILALIAPIQWLIVLVFIFILTDTGFGIWSAKRKGIKLTSSKLSAFIPKALVYLVFILLSFALDVVILGDFIKLFTEVDYVVPKVTGLVLIINELFSIDEKLKSVNPGMGIWYYIKKTLRVAKGTQNILKSFKDEEQNNN